LVVTRLGKKFHAFMFSEAHHWSLSSAQSTAHFVSYLAKITRSHFDVSESFITFIRATCPAHVIVCFIALITLYIIHYMLLLFEGVKF